MMVGGSRLRQIGWAVVLCVCMAGFVVLTFRVNAVKSEVRLAERQIISLERQKLMLETEFETRANQQQLADWNRVDFGYQAPRADQFLENERQLAALGMPRSPGAPEPIRVAHASVEEGEVPAMVSPMTGQPVTPSREESGDTPLSSAGRGLAERLSRSNPIGTALAEAGE